MPPCFYVWFHRRASWREWSPSSISDGYGGGWRNTRVTPLPSTFFIKQLKKFIYSQCRTFRGYQLLIQTISNIEEKLRLMEVDELGVYFRDVSYQPWWSHSSKETNHCYSFGRAQVVLEVMIQPTWSPLSPIGSFPSLSNPLFCYLQRASLTEGLSTTSQANFYALLSIIG